MPLQQIKRRSKERQKVSPNNKSNSRNNSPNQWNSRFNVSNSSGNRDYHQFYRAYFDKQPKQMSTVYRVRYAQSSNQLPHVIDISKKNHTKFQKQAHMIVDRHKNIKKVANETRMPVIKGQSKVFPTYKKHFEMVDGWQNDFIMTRSRMNDIVYHQQREFFDSPIKYESGEWTNKTTKRRPMDLYEKMTPLHSQQSVKNFQKALMHQKKAELARKNSKSVITYGMSSDDFGQIPNLRPNLDRAKHDRAKAFRTMNNSLTSFEARANATVPYNSNFIFQTETSFAGEDTNGKRNRKRRSSNSPMLTLESHQLETDKSIKIASPKKRKANPKKIKNMRDLRRSIQAKSSRKLLGSDSAQFLND